MSPPETESKLTPKVILYYLNRPNVWALEETFANRNIIEVEHLNVIRNTIDPAVTATVMIFDQQFKDYDIDYYDSGTGLPDWRQQIVFERACSEIQAIHKCFPNSKIFAVDCVSLSSDDLISEMIDENIPEEVIDCHLAQLNRERAVWKKVRERFSQENYWINQEFSLTSGNQDSLAERIVNLITAAA